jgi:hypothetical protein
LSVKKFLKTKMKKSKSTRENWDILPNDIWTIVLEFVFCPQEGTITYASVCRYWWYCIKHMLHTLESRIVYITEGDIVQLRSMDKDKQINQTNKRHYWVYMCQKQLVSDVKHIVLQVNDKLPRNIVENFPNLRTLVVQCKQQHQELVEKLVKRNCLGNMSHNIKCKVVANGPTISPFYETSPLT